MFSCVFPAAAPRAAAAFSSSSEGARVFASLQDTVRLATYNISAHNDNSMVGKLKQRFEVKFRNDLRTWP